MRFARRLSRRALAEVAGVSPEAIYTYERRGRTPRVSTVELLAAALDLPAGGSLAGESPHGEGGQLGLTACFRDRIC